MNGLLTHQGYPICSRRLIYLPSSYLTVRHGKSLINQGYPICSRRLIYLPSSYLTVRHGKSLINHGYPICSRRLIYLPFSFFNSSPWKIPYKWRYLDGKIIYIWSIYTMAMLNNWMNSRINDKC